MLAPKNLIMSIKFSLSQRNAVQHIWLLALLLLILAAGRYIANEYTPDTYKFTLIWRLLDWAFNSLIFGWYFYKNGKFILGLLVQLLFLPFFAFRFDLYNYIDYHTFLDNSEIIYTLIYGFGIAIPLLFFSFFYGRAEKINKTLRNKLACFLLALILFVVVYSSLDKIFNIVRYVSFTPNYLQDVFFGFIAIINTLKLICVFVGFLYISSHLKSYKTFINPIEKGEVTSAFFKNGFIVSYTMLFVAFLSLGEDMVAINVFTSEYEFMDVVSHISILIVAIIAARFLGKLIQYRGYTLKRYFGVLNTLLLIPVLNIIPIFILLLSKKSKQTPLDYIKGNDKKRTIHLFIFGILLLVFTFLRHRNGELAEPIIFTCITIVVTSILAYYKTPRKYLYVIVAVLYVGMEVKAGLYYFDFLPFISDHIVRIALFILPSMLALYYAYYYILHKSFYTEDSLENQEKFMNAQEKIHLRNLDAGGGNKD